MTAPNSLSLARVLAAPWQQRRNVGSPWSVVLVLGMCFVVPGVLLACSLFADSAQASALQRAFAARSAWIGIFALMVAAWATLVGNVLQQNQPALARLVPRHPGELRTALLVAWAMVSLAAAAVPGFGFDAPLAWACGAAAGLALLAAAFRWPVLWLSGIAAPFAVNRLTSRFGAAEFEEALGAQWEAHRWLWLAVAVTSGAAILVSMIGGGGARQEASYASRQRLRNAFIPAKRDGWGMPAISRYVWLGGAAVNGRPYHWWLDRLLARRDSPVMSRLLAGLGPATHWTSRLFEGFWFLVIVGGICALMSVIFGGSLRAMLLPWIAFSVLTNGCTSALQAVSRLRVTQREQALLVLLPGVPRGARINRWLAWQMSLGFVVSALCGMLLAWALDALADAIQPGVVERATGGMTLGLAAALLPQVVWQWRHWAAMRSSAGVGATLPVLVSVLMGVGLLALNAGMGVGYVPAGITLGIAALAWCAWRWHRMGSEPTALPVGRLA